MGQAELLETRQREISAKISQVSDNRNAEVAAPATDTENLSTLSTAEAIPISKAAFERLADVDPTAKSSSGSVTGAAQRQSQIDSAISDSGGMGMPMRAGIGAFVGLIFGIVLVLVLDRVDPRIRTKADTEEAFGWPVIGEIPAFSRRDRSHTVLIASDEPRSRGAEAFRVLRSALLFAEASETTADDHPIFASTPEPTAGDGADDTGGHRGQVIMVTSPGPSEGKTTTAANLAAILAETGRSVLVVNCDFRRPRVHLHLDGADETRKVVDTKVPGVKLVTQVLDNPQDANPAEVVRVQRQVIRNAREMFDIVLLDTAPILTTNDATEVLNIADQVVIVAKAGKTHREAADRAAELLERRNAPVVGAVLVGATDIPNARYYYYGGDEQRAEDSTASAPLDELLEPVGAPTSGSVFADTGPTPTVDASPTNGSGNGATTGNGTNGHHTPSSGDAAGDQPDPDTDAAAADSTRRGRPRRSSSRSGGDTPGSRTSS